MTRVRPSPQQGAIERYLDSGEHDTMRVAWPGDKVMGRGRMGTGALREALMATDQRPGRRRTVVLPAAPVSPPAPIR